MTEITIRAMESDDLADYSRIHNHPDIVRQIMQPPYLSLDEHSQRSRSSDNKRSLVAESDGVIVGVGEIRIFQGRRAHAASIGLAVNPDHHGNGIGSGILRALLNLGEQWYSIRRFELKVYTDNERAIALYTRFGFEIEATHRQFAQREGRYVDAYSMARLVT